MNKQWIKLYLEILNDPKMGKMPDSLWRFTVELFLLAGENGTEEGYLPSIADIAWKLRRSEDAVRECLDQLKAMKIVCTSDGESYFVTNFQKRQEVTESTKRWRKYRDRHSDDEKDDESAMSQLPEKSQLSEEDKSGGDPLEEQFEAAQCQTVEPTLNHGLSNVGQALVKQQKKIESKNRIEEDKEKELNNGAANSPPASTPVLRLFMAKWRAKRVNTTQKARLIEIEELYSYETIKEFAEWAHVKNMAFGDAINCAGGTLKKWNKPKLKSNNGKLAPSTMTDEERRAAYKNWGSVP